MKITKYGQSTTKWWFNKFLMWQNKKRGNLYSLISKDSEIFKKLQTLQYPLQLPPYNKLWESTPILLDNTINEQSTSIFQ